MVGHTVPFPNDCNSAHFLDVDGERPCRPSTERSDTIFGAMVIDASEEQCGRETHALDGIVGASPVLLEVIALVRTVAPTDSTVLLVGETGTGKELVARAIHTRSRRNNRSFVKLNCAAMPTGLLENELFGHEKGAFTGAIRRGRMDLADQGTLFLDEVGDIPIEIQPKLLRALQEREFERLGSTHTRRVNGGNRQARHAETGNPSLDVSGERVGGLHPCGK